MRDVEFDEFSDTPRRTVSKGMIVSFLIGIIVGAGGYWGIDARSGGNMADTREAEETVSGQGEDEDALTALSNNQSSNPTSSVAKGENTLVVITQPAGARVITSMIALSQSSWVAVHEVLPDGTMGNILGAKRLDEGKYFGEHIELLRETKGGRAYYVVIHTDDGDSEFNFEREVPFVDANGEIIRAEFTVTSADSDSAGEDEVGDVSEPTQEQSDETALPLNDKEEESP